MSFDWGKEIEEYKNLSKVYNRMCQKRTFLGLNQEAVNDFHNRLRAMFNFAKKNMMYKKIALPWKEKIRALEKENQVLRKKANEYRLCLDVIKGKTFRGDR
jgi:hypothetical protein